MAAHNAAGGVDGVSVPLAISSLAAALEPTYSKSIPKRDGWGKAFTCFTDEDWGGTSPVEQILAFL